MRPIPVLLAAATLAVPAVATAVPPPTVSGPSGPIREAPTYTIASDAFLPEYSWSVSGPADRSGSGTTAALGPLPDGEYVFAARQSVLLGGPPNPSEPATVAFTLDTVAPGPPALAVPASSEDTTPRIAWSGEPGSRYTWRVTRGAVPVRGPVTTTDLETAIVPALAEGDYLLEVRQTDAAGNEGPPSVAPFAIALPRPPLGAPGPAGQLPPEPAAAAPAVGGASPPSPGVRRRAARGTLFPERLSPPDGRRVRTLRPVLRWIGRPAGTTLFNLQIFDGRRKVHSAFPKGNRYKVPPGVLRHARRYVWRVWPFRGRLGYAIRPLGVSAFTTPRPPRAR